LSVTITATGATSVVTDNTGANGLADGTIVHNDGGGTTVTIDICAAIQGCLDPIATVTTGSLVDPLDLAAVYAAAGSPSGPTFIDYTDGSGGLYRYGVDDDGNVTVLRVPGENCCDFTIEATVGGLVDVNDPTTWPAGATAANPSANHTFVFYENPDDTVQYLVGYVDENGVEHPLPGVCMRTKTTVGKVGSVTVDSGSVPTPSDSTMVNPNTSETIVGAWAEVTGTSASDIEFHLMWIAAGTSPGSATLLPGPGGVVNPADPWILPAGQTRLDMTSILDGEILPAGSSISDQVVTAAGDGVNLNITVMTESCVGSVPVGGGAGAVSVVTDNTGVTGLADGTIVHNDGDGTTVTIDICAAIQGCLSPIETVPGGTFTSPLVVTEAESYVVAQSISGPTVLEYDHGDGTTYRYFVDDDGNASLIQTTGISSGAVSVFTDNTGANGLADGTFVHNDGDGTTVTVDVCAAIQGCLSPIATVPGGTFTSPLVVTEAESYVTAQNISGPTVLEYDHGDGTTYRYFVDDDGNASLIQTTGVDTGSVSVLTDNTGANGLADGTIVHNDGDGTTVTVDICAAIQGCLSPIATVPGGSFTSPLVVTEAESYVTAQNISGPTVLEYDHGDGTTYRYFVDDDGNASLIQTTGLDACCVNQAAAGPFVDPATWSTTASEFTLVSDNTGANGNILGYTDDAGEYHSLPKDKCYTIDNSGGGLSFGDPEAPTNNEILVWYAANASPQQSGDILIYTSPGALSLKYHTCIDSVSGSLTVTQLCCDTGGVAAGPSYQVLDRTQTSIVYDVSLGPQAFLPQLLAGGRTVANLTNASPGDSGQVFVQGSSFPPAWGSLWDFGPDADTAPNVPAWILTNDNTKGVVLSWRVEYDGTIQCSVREGHKAPVWP
jgi:hypothetical protein